MSAQRRARVTQDGRIICPDCGAQLAKALFGAHANNIELWCRKCRSGYILRIQT